MTTVFGGGSSIPLFRIAGFRIGVHPSWFLVLFLWIAFLQDSFASVLGSDSQGFTAAVLAAFLFFGSIIRTSSGTRSPRATRASAWPASTCSSSAAS